MGQMLFEQSPEKLFLAILNMSLTSSAVILAILLARLALRRAPKIFSYVLWAAALFRLLCPVSFSLPLSLLGALQNEPAKAGRMEYIAADIGYMEKPELTLPVPGLGSAVNAVLPQAAPESSVNPMQMYLRIGAYVWLIGILGMGLYSAVSVRRLHKRIQGAVLEQEFVYRPDRQEPSGGGSVYRIAGNVSPFVYGLFSPRIYLPEKMGAAEREYVLLHEQIHIRRGDAFFRLLAWLALWLHWFNPLVWLAFALSGRDMEMSCDEAVLLRLGRKVKKGYSASLLQMAAGNRVLNRLPLAFGESDTGNRIVNVLRYRKPTALLLGMAAVFSIFLAVFFLANPSKAKEDAGTPDAATVGAAAESGAGTTDAAVADGEQGAGAPSAETGSFAKDGLGTPEYTDILSEDSGSELHYLVPERLQKGELSDGMYIVYVRSISKSARGFDSYVTDGEETELPLLPFAENCVFRANVQMDKIGFEEVDFDTFANLVTDAVKVINPLVYCAIEDNKVVRADLWSAYYINGISYARPVKNTSTEDLPQLLGMTMEEILAKFYVSAGTEMADIGDSVGEERIEIYTGDIGDGGSGILFFQDAVGNVLGTEFAHESRAGWNNIYLGEAGGTGFILTVHIEDRDDYGGYGYRVFRFGEAGEIMQIAGSSFDWGGQYQYDDALFHTWADNLSYYLERSHLILSSQDGEIRTEQISEADKYNYETLRRK